MSGKFKITLSNGDTYEAADDQEFDAMMSDFTAEGLDPKWQESAVPAAPAPIRPQPTAAVPASVRSEPSTWETFKRAALPALKGAGDTAADGYRALTYGLTLGYDDDIADGVAKLAQRLGYQGSGKSAAQANAEAMRRSPYVTTAAKTIGNMATGIGAGIVAAPVAAATGLTPAAVSILESGVLGAAQAGGEAESDKLAAAGRGATFGLGAGVAGVGVGVLGSKLADSLKRKSLGYRGQVLAPTMKVTQDLQDRYGAAAADDKLGEMLERHAPPNAFFGKGAGEYRDKLAAELQKTGQRLRDTVAEAGLRGGNQAVPAAQEQLVQQISERADEVGAQVGQINANTEAQLRRYLDQLTGKADKFAPVRVSSKTMPQDLAGFWKQKQNFEADARYSPTGSAPDTAVSLAAQTAADENRDLLKGIVRQHAPDLDQAFRDGNVAYGETAMLKDIASRASASEANTMPVGALIRNAAVGAGLGAGAGWALDKDPATSAVTGAALLTGTGTFPALQRAANAPAGRDMLANLARTTGRATGAISAVAGNPVATASVRAVGTDTMFTDEDRLRRQVRAGANVGPLTAQLQAAVEDDDAFNRLANEALKDTAVQAAVRGSK